MPDVAQPARPVSIQAILAVALLVFGVFFGVMYKVTNSREDHSFNAGATPPLNVELSIGKQYEISTPGGVDEVANRGADLKALGCTYTTPDNSDLQPLDVTPIEDGRTTHAVATFNSPITATVHVQCAALTKTFVDDADNGSADVAGFFILMCTITLTAGVALGLSVLYRRQPRVSRGSRPSWLDDPTYQHLLAPAVTTRPFTPTATTASAASSDISDTDHLPAVREDPGHDDLGLPEIRG
jgi:hypothetical protein